MNLSTANKSEIYQLRRCLGMPFWVAAFSVISQMLALSCSSHWWHVWGLKESQTMERGFLIPNDLIHASSPLTWEGVAWDYSYFQFLFSISTCLFYIMITFFVGSKHRCVTHRNSFFYPFLSIPSSSFRLLVPLLLKNIYLPISY